MAIDLEDRIEIDNGIDLNANLDRINTWINNADSKANIAIAIELIVVGFALQELKEAKRYFLSPGAPTVRVAFAMLWATFGSTIVYALIQSVLVIYPRLSSGNKETKPSVTFFVSIASNSEEEFKGQLGRLSREDVNDELASQCYINACIANKKFAYYAEALPALAISAISILIIYVWLALTK